ncbi:phiSA1p31-related protein [Streptomyces alboflavus]|uniref:phiSA1p31-related protein n=1 Tax=Streptomyces alboflavus TaxID=67267 RepID=UPI000F657878|nr:phiSA1p31-related protein [Streptomyces alboflavus]
MTNFRFVDLDEQALVVLVERDGSYEVQNPALCNRFAAALLRGIAEQLDASHPPHPCTPGDGAEPHHERPAEPLISHAGTLDRERKMWTDGTGHAWDLSLPWTDAADRSWRWHGSLDRQGTPIMRSGDGAEVQPLDVVRALWGPIAPLSGGAA